MTHRIAARFAWISAGVVFGAFSTAAMMLAPPVLNPTTYTSAAGRCTLSVEPSDLYGRGSALYRLTRDGETAWSGERPFTLWQAGVADDGTVAGYAYTHGWDGRRHKDGQESGAGALQIVILWPDGEERLSEAVPRGDSYFDELPGPVANGIIFDAENDRFVARLRDPRENGERWHVYQLSTGKSLGILNPSEKASVQIHRIIAAAPVAGTPLTLVQWWGYVGARFMLMDPDLNPVWSLDLDRDYAIPGDETAENRLRQRIEKDSAILSAGRPSQFDLHFVAEKKRVTFSVQPDGQGGWAVAETARADYPDPGDPAVAPVVFPDRELPYLGKIALEAGAPAVSPFRDIRALELDGEGRICFLRSEADGPPALVLVGTNGAVQREIPIELMRGRTNAELSAFAWIGGERFVFAISGKGTGARAACAAADFATGAVTIFEGLDCPRIEQLAGYPEGGFVALTKDFKKYTITDGLYGFDAAGRTEWKIEKSGYRGEPGELISPQDLTVDASGRIAVISTIRRNIQFYDRDGKFLHLLNLSNAWGRVPNYPTDVAADPRGGLIAYDFGGKPCIVRMDGEGAVVAQFDPAYPDGRTFAFHDGVRISPDGRYWTSDGHALLRLDESGVVDRVLGSAMDYDRLEDIGRIAVDGADRIYIFSGRSRAVHVFGPDGARAFVCRTDPGDQVAGDLVPTGKGDLFLSSAERRSEYLHFSDSGERLGIEKLGLGDYGEAIVFQPDTGNRWVAGFHDVTLVSPSGAVLRTISRRPDGCWLENPDGLSVAPDGSVAVVARRSRADAGPNTVNLYTAAGDPVRTIPLPESMGYMPSAAWNGRHLFVRVGDDIHVLDAAGRPVQKFTPGACSHGPFVAAQGREVWVFDEGARTFHRYRAP
jgi:sugar lactone lactonase YvrE